MKLDNETVEEWFPTFVRYTGLITTVVLIGFSLAGYSVQAAPGFVAAGGMILYKTIHDSAKDERRKPRDEEK